MELAKVIIVWVIGSLGLGITALCIWGLTLHPDAKKHEMSVASWGSLCFGVSLLLMGVSLYMAPSTSSASIGSIAISFAGIGLGMKIAQLIISRGGTW
jgi:hypothetical protein